MTLDRIGNEINVGDIIVSYNNIYNVLSVEGSYLRVILINPSKTTRSLRRWRRDVVVITSLVSEIERATWQTTL